MEEGELVAERLPEVTAVADDDGNPAIGFLVRTDGTVRARRTSAQKGVMPSSPEEFRAKVRVMAHMWEFLRLRFPDRPLLQGYSQHMWQDCADFILGDRVAGITLARPRRRMCASHLGP